MQIAVIVRTLGVLLLLFSTTLLAPMVVSLIYDDGEFTHLALTFGSAVLNRPLAVAPASAQGD